MQQVLAEAITELNAEARAAYRAELERSVRDLTLELTELKTTLAELKATFLVAERAKIIEMSPHRADLN